MPTGELSVREYLKSWWIRIGLVGLVVGTGPLASIMVVARLGWMKDPNPNPVFFGILAGLTFWPSIGLIAVGVWRCRKQTRTT
jgi:hypothetical protein